MNDYKSFLKSKVAIAKDDGFEVGDLNKALFPHQSDSVRWALKGGRRAIFAAFGNGKTNMGIELAYQCALHTGKKSLIICPLGVKQEFEHDAVNILGYTAPTYVKNQAEIEQCDNKLLITNYERVRDGDIDVTYFGCTVLDEAAVLRSFGSKTYQTFLDKFKGVQERLDKDNKLPATFMVCAPASWNESVWDDIVRMRTLNSEQSRRRQQMHVCPLQLDIVERLINRYSNKGDKVLDFFGGIMTVPYLAAKMERYGVGIELNSDYFRDGLAYCKQADLEKSTPTLFDFLGEGA